MAEPEHSTAGPSPSPSSVLVLGVLAGILAFVAVVPILYPLSTRLEQDRLALATMAVQSVAADLSVDTRPLSLARIERVGVSVSYGATPPETLGTDARCLPKAQFIRSVDGWLSAACRTRADGSQVWSWARIEQGSGSLGTVSLVSLALIVGFSTALGTFQFLAPLRRIPAGLARLEAGDRQVVLPHTGLREVDELIDRINATAAAMADREDAIQGRLEVVKQLARMVAHEVRNPLQSMEFMAELLKTEADPDERQELAASLHQEIRGLEGVVVKLLDRPESLTLNLSRVPTRPATLIERILRLRRPESQAVGVSMRSRTIPDVSLPVDRALMTRALENLVVNALAFVPRPGGHIEVAVELHEEDLWLLVDDNGPGLDPEETERVFEPGVSHRPGGHGLGLVFVRGVARAHGGTADAGRSPLGGARFRIVLPLNADEGESS